MSRKPLIVVALGGNAISRPEEEGNVRQQFDNSKVTAVALADLIEQGNQLVITHGNGPQIGNFLLRNEAAANAIYPLPMEVAVAHVQGGMGYMIAQTLTNELQKRDREEIVAAIVTTILVDQDDPSFKNPTKPIGRVLSKGDADRFGKEEGWAIREVSPGKFRRVVASPVPRHISEIELIRRSVEAGDILVTCGGGGVPVVRDSSAGLRGVKAVIDKDLASGLLAAELNATLLMILTNVDRVAINFGKADQRELEQMTVSQARAYMAEGQFPAGSMGPKVQGAVNFIEHSKRRDAQVIIGPLHKAADAVAGRVGTRITRD